MCRVRAVDNTSSGALGENVLAISNSAIFRKVFNMFKICVGIRKKAQDIRTMGNGLRHVAQRCARNFRLYGHFCDPDMLKDVFSGCLGGLRPPSFVVMPPQIIATARGHGGGVQRKLINSRRISL